MPIYEYICDDCGKKFDMLRTMSKADVPAECENCHSYQTHRKISVCYSQSEGRSISVGNSGCGSCSGRSCSSCRH